MDGATLTRRRPGPRLPGGQRLTAAAAARVISVNFPASHALGSRDALAAVRRFSGLGIAGAAVYDGLVALAAKDAGVLLLSCDRRALPAYQRLDVGVEIV